MINLSPCVSSLPFEELSLVDLDYIREKVNFLILKRLEEAASIFETSIGKKHMVLWPADDEYYPATLLGITGGLIEVLYDEVEEGDDCSFMVSADCIGVYISG